MKNTTKPAPQVGQQRAEERPGMHVGRIWISITTAIGAFSVSLLSIYLGYLLFVAGATGTFKFDARTGDTGVGLESVAPGLGFAFFGAGIAIFALYRLIGRSK